ncbi:MAG: SH3 domain-containing protein, partial [Clostridia bacterium]
MKRFLSVVLALTLLLSLAPTTSSMALSKYATVQGGLLRLRSDASFNASTINSYDTGTRVEVLGTSGSWYYVKTPDGNTGYMYGSYLNFSGGDSGDSGDSGDTGGGTGSATVTSGNGYGVRLRRGPGTGYGIVRSYAVGTRVTVLQSGSYWSKIKIGSTTGYMMNKFLDFGGGPGESGGTVVGNATIWSRNGYGVRLRSSASTNSGIIGVYSVGTNVDILEYGHTWCKIQVGSRVGYMMTEFLNTRETNEVTKVTLNITKPLIGDQLSVSSITPSRATVDYDWIVDGMIVSTSSTFWLNDPAYAGKVVTLRITGNGNYTGSATVQTSPVLTEKQSLSTAVVTLNNLMPAVGDTLRILSVVPEDATYKCAWIVNGKTVGTGSTLNVGSAYKGQPITLTLTGTGLYKDTCSVDTSPVLGKEDHPIITNVTVSNLTAPAAATPNIGHVLEAMPEPDTNQAKFTWYVTDVNGNRKTISNSRKLTVQKAYENYDISVDVKGTGSYESGNPVDATANVGMVTALKRITGITLEPLTNLRFVKGTGSVADKGTTLTVKVSASASVPDPSLAFSYEWFANGTPVGTSSKSYTVTEADIGSKISVRVTALDSSAWTAEEFTKETTELVKSPINALQLVGTTNGTVSVGDSVGITLNPGSATYNNVTWYVNNVERTVGSSYVVQPGDARSDRMCTLKAVVTGDGIYYGTISATARVNMNSTSSAALSNEIVDANGVIVSTTEIDGSITPPVEGTVSPAESTTPPTESTTPPAESTTPPTEGVTPPTEGITPPVEGGTVPSESVPPVENPTLPTETALPGEGTVPSEGTTPVEVTNPVVTPDPGQAVVP